MYISFRRRMYVSAIMYVCMYVYITYKFKIGQSKLMYIPFRSRNFVSELEAYVYFKNQRTFRLVNDHSLTPPWCLTVAAVGHTFSTGTILHIHSYVHTYIHTNFHTLYTVGYHLTDIYIDTDVHIYSIYTHTS